MRLSFAVLAALLAVLAGQTALGATVHGNVYDLSLAEVSGARVAVNSTPAQQMISTDEGYSFNLKEGTYLLEAQLVEQRGVRAEDNRTLIISDDGNYVIDLILFPVFDENGEPVVDEELAQEEEGSVTSAAAFLLLLIAGVGLYWFAKRQEKQKGKVSERRPEQDQEAGDLERLTRIIREEGGRITQRDLRKKIPLSEAKISLMVAELEKDGRIEKIKKGRGNIIILKR